MQQSDRVEAPDMSGAFHDTVLSTDAHIVDMRPRPSTQKSMRGESDLIYTTEMNQGSVSMAGAYGPSGLARVTAAVSAYAGSSSADHTKSVNITYEVLISAGVETIRFDDLNPVDLMMAFKGAPRESIANVLNGYGSWWTNCRTTT
jgi:hypothetical protein